MEGVNQSIDSFIPFPLSHAPPDSTLVSLDPCFFPPFGGDGSSGREGGGWVGPIIPPFFYLTGQAVRAASHSTRQFNLWDIGG